VVWVLAIAAANTLYFELGNTWVHVAIKFDEKSGAYTDGTHYVKASIIRKFARERMGKPQLRGRLSKEMIEAFWLDTYGRATSVN